MVAGGGATFFGHPQSGPYLRVPAGKLPEAVRYSEVKITKIFESEWMITGDLKADPDYNPD